MSIPLERLPGLILFARVAQYGSLSGAAKSLGLSRSAVSKQLTNFEAQIGARLIQRTTRKLALTELGEQILREAQRVETALNAVESITDNFREQVRGKLRISCSTSLGRVLLLPLLTEFSARYPEVELELGLEDRFVDLVAEQVDAAIRIGHLPDSSLIARRLGELSWQVTASPAYIALSGEPQVPADLAQHACLYYRNSSRAMNNWPFICSEDGSSETVKVQGPLAINDACALVDAAIRGLGILLIDKALVEEPIAKGQLIPLLKNYPPAPGFPVYVVYPARDYLPAKTIAFVDFLMESLKPKLI
ncbi:MAG TPA: LysR family transcriptional regulator [Cellvibrio sp.]|nr:LysR family transcriptional regulator [Cellvibrio sp.]